MIKSSYIVVAASNTWRGRLIRRLTRSKFNHCFLLFHNDFLGGWWTIQIDDEGVRILPAERVLKLYSLIEVYEYLDGDLVRGIQACRNRVGRKYDWKGLFGFYLKLMSERLFGRNIQNPLQGNHREFCSEYVVEVLQAVGAKDFLYQQASSYSPGKVQLILRSSSRFQKVGLEDLLQRG